MQQLSNYQTLFQLGVGINLVVGAYSSHRKTVEDRIKAVLDLYREQMDEVVSATIEPMVNIEFDLEKRPVKQLSDRELSRYLSDCTIRFYKRRELFMSRDGIVEPLLYPVGFLSLAMLLYASFWPETEISSALIYPTCALLLGPAVFSLVRLLVETKQHERYYRGRMSKNFRNKIESRHEERLRTAVTPGEIVKVTNAVRLRYSALKAARRKARGLNEND